MVFNEVGKSFPPTWEPEPNQFIEGELIDIENEVGENKSTVYVIKTKETGTFSVWGSTVLDDKLNGIAKGKIVRITFLGKIKKYKNYKVEVDDGKD